MKQTRGDFIQVYAIPAILSILFLFPGRSRAQQEKQQIVSGEFSLSQEVRWENSVLPMGDYIYHVDSSKWPALVRVEQSDGDFSGIFIPQVLLQPGSADRNGLVLSQLGNETYITGLYLRGGAGELSFSLPRAEKENQIVKSAQEQVHVQESGAALAKAAEYLTILNPSREKIAVEEIEKVYLSACAAVEKEYKRPTAVRPRLVLRLGTNDNLLRLPMWEIQLKKWDENRFADAVVELALREMISHEDRTRLSKMAVTEAGATVNVCELKACIN